MNTKTCSKCGWVYPGNTPYSTCRFCGTYMGEPIRPKPSPQPPRPPAPPKPVYASRMERERAIAADTYETWKTRLSNLQINTLTEDEWLKACNHFDGCAMCSSDSIDARGYFIAFKEGGKYNRCNILPLCDKIGRASCRERVSSPV